jgi:hypothetical protein
MDWATAPQCRDQIVLFPTRLDEAIGADHSVRLLDTILSQLDWSQWESLYDLRRGQPPIHPRILAGVILYGLLKRPDEKFVTERAYDNPKFVEDLVRDVAAVLNLDERIDAYVVESENFESIHNHSAYALIERNKRAR